MIWHVDFEIITSPFTRTVFVLSWHSCGDDWDCDVIVDVEYGRGEWKFPFDSEFYTWDYLFDTRLILWFLQFAVHN